MQKTIPARGMGVAGIAKSVQMKSAQDSKTIQSGFQSLESLKGKAKNLIEIASGIKAKLESKSESEMTEEEKEIQQVMFNMGMTSNFSSTVSKDLSGKHFHRELANEVEQFLTKGVLESLGGVISLLDLFCMYNRARGTDLVSPNDLTVAVRILADTPSSKVSLKVFASGVKVVQLRAFDQDIFY